MFKTESIDAPSSSNMPIQPGMTICQKDYPLDWYPNDFIPYAESYLALPDRQLTTVVNWMTPYMKKARDHFGDQLLLLAHYYMAEKL